MMQTACHPDYFLKLQNKILFLMGTMSNGLPLWDMLQRETAAKANVETSLATIDQQPHLFIGIEHLPYLLNHAANIKSEIVIVEKSKMLFDFYQQKLHFADNIPKNFKIIFGDVGFYPHYLDTKGKLSLLGKDVTILALQMYQSNISHWENIIIHSLGACKEDESFYPYMFQSVLLIIAAKKFHRNHAAIYQQIKTAVKVKKIIYAISSHPTVKSYSLQHYPEPLFRDYQKITMELDHYNMDPTHHTLFATIKTIPNNDFNHCFKIFENNALRLLTAIQTHLPKMICTLNRSIFNTLEDMLFMETMIRETTIPYTSYLIDLITQAGELTSGLSSYHFIENYFSHPNYYLLSVNEQMQKNYGVHNNPTRIYPFFFNELQHTILKPQADPQQYLNDIVVMQHTDATYFQVPLTAALFYLVQQNYRGPHLAQAFINFIHQLRIALKNTPYPSLNFNLLLNDIDFAFYQMFRVAFTLRCLTALKPYRVKFYGRYWESFLPTEYCGGVLANHEAMQLAYNQSKLALIMSLAYNNELPHHSAVQAYSSGCLPLSVRPAHDYPTGSVYQNFAKNEFVYFANETELAQQIGLYLNNEAARQNKILHAQSELAQLQQQQNYPTIDQVLQSRPIMDSMGDVDFRITDSPELDQDMIQIAISYLNHYFGFLDLSLSQLHTVLMKKTVTSVEAIQLAIHLAEQFKDKGKLQDLHQIIKC